MLFDNISNKVRVSEKHLKLKSENCKKISRNEVKVLPGNKVNRQLFESEVQLIKALENIRFRNKSLKTGVHIDNISKENSTKTAIVTQNNENPIDLIKDVINLPDDIVTRKTNSEFISNIIEVRKLKFNKSFEEFHQILGIINKQTESMISELSKALTHELTEMKEQLKKDLLCIESSINENSLIRDNFENLEVKIKANYQLQRSSINTFNTEILNVEASRIDKIVKQMSKSILILIKTGHLAPSEVHRIIYSILIKINLSLLENKEIFCDLITRLHMSAINENRNTQIYFNVQFTLWQNNSLTNYLQETKNKITKEISYVPSAIQKDLESLNSIICNLSVEIENTFNSIKNKMNPEIEDENLIGSWNSFLISIMKEYNKNCEIFIRNSYKKFEMLYQQYLNELSILKTTILNHRIFDDMENCSMIVDRECLPLLGQLHSTFEKYLHEIELFTESASEKLKMKIEKLEDFLQTLWNIWKSHEYQLKKTETNITDQLASNALLNHEQNLSAENEFNIIIDKMRQNSNEHSLKDSLKKSLNLLDKMKISYSTFYDKQISVVKRYPSMVENDVKQFEEDIEKFFTKDYLTADDDNIVEETTLILKDEVKDTEDDVSCYKEKNDDEVECKIKRLHIIEIFKMECWKDVFHGVESNFKNFIEKWYKIVAVNTNKIVIVKTDELDCELKLRNHLHEPRYKRTEFDVHNVRLAELKLHNERVLKHCKKIENSLNGIMEHYGTFEKENKVKQEQFREKLFLSVENSVNISNTTKCNNINQLLQVKNQEYTNNFRMSLREFRKTVDDKLQTLRQSNVDFVTSFKIFSMGGNYGLDEIKEYAQKIEKANKKIDNIESEIICALEIVEKQHNDTLIQSQNLVEEKFKFHIVDINFLEKLNRAICSVQVKIRTEVSNSNSQSQAIYEELRNLKLQFVDAQNHSEHKRENNFLCPLMENIRTLFHHIQNRCFYLNCMKIQLNPKQKSQLSDDSEGLNVNKVQFSAITILSKTGKQPNEDAGIKIVKNLIQSQNMYLFSRNIKSEVMDKDKQIKNIKAKIKSSSQSDDKNSAQQGPASHSASMTSESRSSSTKTQNEKNKLINKKQRSEKKYQIFSEDISEDFTFLNKIKSYCKDILDAVLHFSELYYRNKGIRKVTHPNLFDSFDLTAENFIYKLKIYVKQTEEYHVECIQEFRKQLVELENVLNPFPSIIYTDLLNEIMFECCHEFDNAIATQMDDYQQLVERRTINYRKLKSDLGEPNRENELKLICLDEEKRKEEELEFISKTFEKNNKILFLYGQKFVQSTTDSTQQLVLLMDNILTTNDIQSDDIKKQVVGATELIRTHFQDSSGDKEDHVCEEDIKTVWCSKDLEDILKADTACNNEDDNIPKEIISAKFTSFHDTIKNERSNMIKKFKTFYFDKLNSILINKEKQMQQLKNYTFFWKDSIKKLELFI